MLYCTFLFAACIFIVQNTQAIEYDPNQIIIKYKSAPNVNLNSSTFNSRSTANRYITKKINDTSPNLYLLEGANISERLEEFNANPDIEYAEPNFYRYPYNITVSKLLPNILTILFSYSFKYKNF